MFEILMYLFENYVHNSDSELLVDEEHLTKELIDAGFAQPEILRALEWLERLAEIQEDGKPYLGEHKSQSFRIYTREEISKLNVECRDLLLSLEKMCILTVETREMVIDRVMELDEPELDLEDLKWVILMVLFNARDSEIAYENMEDFMFDGPSDSRFLHS